MNRPQFSVRLLIGLVTLAATGIAFYLWTIAVHDIKFHDDPSNWPNTVLRTSKELESYKHGMTINEFGSKLHESGLTETERWQHFKDFEFYWAIDQKSQSEPRFIIAATFFPITTGSPLENLALNYATINVIEKPSRAWRTVWSIEYRTNDTFSWHDVKIRKPTNESIHTQ